VEIFQGRQLLPAPWSPRGPEAEKNNLAAVLAQTYTLTGNIGQCEFRRLQRLVKGVHVERGDHIPYILRLNRTGAPPTTWSGLILTGLREYHNQEGRNEKERDEIPVPFMAESFVHLFIIPEQNDNVISMTEHDHCRLPAFGYVMTIHEGEI